MNARRWSLSLIALLAAASLATTASASFTLDRDYRLGDDLAEGAANGNPVSVTFDSAGQPGMSQLIDLNAAHTPVYRTITGRPDGVGGLGIEFNGAQSEYLQGPALGDPNASVSAIAQGGTIDYTGIVNRGLQFWVKPQSTAAQTLVMDTNRHGARINGSGRFSMRYNGLDFDTNVAATPGVWRHVMVVRPFNAAGGSRMYIDGVAVAFAPGGYDDDIMDMVVGANTDLNSEFFTGVIDDLKLFVMGSNVSGNYGSFNLATDNEYLAFKLSAVAGDVNNDGLLDGADKTAFINGWFDQHVVNGMRLGDYNTRLAGDLNLDGITNIFDLAVLQNALNAAGLPAVTPAELAAAAVPEPAGLCMAAAAGLVGLARLRSQRQS
jgi:hypothetical protein